MFGAIAGGIASALAGGAMSKLFGGGQKAASGGIQGVKMRLKKRLLAFSRRLHARIRKTRYMHKMRCLLINRRSLLLALRLLWKTPIFPSNSRFPRLCA